MAEERKPIALYGDQTPNLASVQILLKELGLAHATCKAPAGADERLEYLAVNPHGGTVCIQDPNTATVLGEMGAVFEYLVSNYDKEHRIIFRRGTPEFWLAKQWLCFQVSAQGPLYALAEQETSSSSSIAAHYAPEINRVTAVLEAQLTRQEQRHPGGDGPWIVGDKMSFVDLSLVAWQRQLGTILERNEYDETSFPRVKSWLDRLAARPSVQAVL